MPEASRDTSPRTFGKEKTLVKSALRIFISVFIGILAAFSIIAAIAAFKVTHFLMMDGIGDAREMMGDGPVPSWWHTFFAGWWFMYYLPATVFSALAIWFAMLSISLFRNQRKQTEQSGPDNPRPCGTSGMPPADPASRAGDMPEASGGI